MTSPQARSDGPGRDLPTFIVIGAMKAGTTSLYHYLRHDPQVSMPRVKELDFFVEEMNWPRGVPWYRQQFADAGPGQARGEASTAYTKFPRFRGVPARMAAVVPEVRLVYVVRDPVERIRSHYQHRVALGAETAPPDVAVEENPIYLDDSRYARQVDQYLEHFAPDQLLIVTSEALRQQRQQAVRRVYEFIGVAPDVVVPVLDTEFYRTAERRSYPPLVYSARQLLKRHVPQAKRAKELVDSVTARRAGPAAARPSDAAAAPPFSAALRDRLAGLLAEDVGRLRAHMDADFDGWGLG